MRIIPRPVLPVVAFALVLSGCGASQDAPPVVATTSDTRAENATPAQNADERRFLQLVSQVGIVADGTNTVVLNMSDEELVDAARWSCDYYVDSRGMFSRDEYDAFETTWAAEAIAAAGDDSWAGSAFHIVRHNAAEAGICSDPIDAGSAEDTPSRAVEAQGAEYSYSCNTSATKAGIGGGTYEEFPDYESVWATDAPVGYCSVRHQGGEFSEDQQEIFDQTFGDAQVYQDDPYRYYAELLAICAETAGDTLAGEFNLSQWRAMEGALQICPDHPQREVLELNIADGKAQDAEQEANSALQDQGKLVASGKYLVGVDVVPGTWETVYDRVENCYWEISDANGNIIDNNFVSVAPRFAITVPSSASGFTVEGCQFRWVSE